MADPTYRAAQPGEFFCPAGGKWYACETGSKFVGCCTSDPCINTCHGNSLRPAGRSTALDSKSPGGSCGGQTPFWTCEQAPTFWGCCNEDPCMNNSTCPQGKLEPTYWDRPDQYEYFKDLNILLSSTAPRPTSTPSPPTSAAPSVGSKVPGALIGGVVGGTLGFVAILAAIVFLLYRRRRRRQKQANRSSLGEQSISVEEKKPGAGELESPLPAAPPTYSWDENGYPLVQQQWAYNNPSGYEVSGENSKASPRSPYSELHSEPSLAAVAELPGGTTANELESLNTTPTPSHTEFGRDLAKQPSGLGLTIEEEPRKSSEKR